MPSVGLRKGCHVFVVRLILTIVTIILAWTLGDVANHLLTAPNNLSVGAGLILWVLIFAAVGLVLNIVWNITGRRKV